jgi:WD40 repeat protein
VAFATTEESNAPAIVIWDVFSGQSRAALITEQGAVTSLDWPATGRHLWAGTVSGAIVGWDLGELPTE